MIGFTRVHKQPIFVFYFELGNKLNFYNLEAWELWMQKNFKES